MNGLDYKRERLRKGYTQKELADLIGLHWVTVARRESGAHGITPEMVAALRSLPQKRNSARIRAALDLGQDPSRILSRLRAGRKRLVSSLASK